MKENNKKPAPSSGEQKSVIAELLHEFDCRHCFFLILVTAFLIFGFKLKKLNFRPGTPLNTQLKYLNPDAKLYYGLAKNIVNGTGFVDTIRNKEIIPSVGHPFLLSIFCIKLGLAPRTFALFFLYISIVLFSLSIRIFTKSNILVCIALLMMDIIFTRTIWLAANIETSVVFVGALLILGLVYFYKSNFRFPWAIMAGIAFALHIFVRPVFLFLMHFSFFVVLGCVLYHWCRRRSKPLDSFTKGWLVLLATAEVCVLSLLLYSHIQYKDSRLVTGTYGAYPLLSANNLQVPVRPLHANWSKEDRLKEKYLKIKTPFMQQGLNWEQRHDLIMEKVIEYWKTHPKRAFQGWWWRFRQYMGIHPYAFKHIRYFSHALAALALVILIPIRIIYARLYQKQKLPEIKSLALVITILFLTYSAIHSFFVYTHFRYVIPAIPFLIASFIFLFSETRELSVKVAMSVLRYLMRLTKKICW